jgi:hypothetical protein
MRVAPTLALLALSGLPLFAGAGLRGTLWDFLSGRRDLEVITVTDMSILGSLRPIATPNEPQYYVATSLGYRDLGGQLAGIEAPPPEAVLHLISSELAKQGYLPATSRSPRPTLGLVYTWGTLNGERFYGPDPSVPPVIMNRRQIVGFLGGPKVGLGKDVFDPLTAPVPGLSAYNYEARTLLEATNEDFYVIMVSAYDLDSALQKKRMPPLWTTRIAAPSLGFNLGDVLPAMLAIGGKQFGRDTPRPIWINASDEFDPKVRMGEIQLLETLEQEPLPVIDASGTEIPRKK